MAQEQTSGIVDPRSDQYGCAVVLYEMLTGYHPLDPLGGSIPPVSTLNTELPTALDAVLQHALAARPEHRFPDMQEFMRAFDLACRPTSTAKMRIPPPIQLELRNTPTARGGTSTSLPAIPTTTGKGSAVNSQPPPHLNYSTGSVREKCREGDQYLKLQHYSQALQAYEEALRMNPNNFYAW